MHSYQICHRDLKLENVMVTEQGRVRLIDFGFSFQCDKNDKMVISCGTPAFMAPEVVKK